MAPKKKTPAPKGNRQISDDEYDVEPAAAAASPVPAASEDNNVDESTFNVDEEGNDLGGLMSLMAAAKKGTGAGGKKGGKKNKKQVDDDEYDVEPLAAQDSAPKADDDDEEDQPAKAPAGKDAKGKPAPKGKGGKQAQAAAGADESDEEIKKLAAQLEAGASLAKGNKKGQAAKAAAPVKAASAAGSDSESDDSGAGGPKSKKQKEKERKARQAAAKKAEQAGKKPAAAAAAPSAKAAAPEPEQPTEEKEDKEGAAGGKKKGKGAGAIGQLKQLLEEKRRLEEEAKRLAEEEQRKIEEEEKALQEEERKKEEAKRLKKEKEKAKKEELKKSGKYLTKAQKEAQAKAAIRNQQLLQLSGVKVAALEGAEGDDAESASPASATAPPKKTRVVYDNKRKKGGQNKAAEPATVGSPKPSEPETVVEMEVDAKPAPVEEKVAVTAPEVKEEVEEVKESWDAESEAEEVKANWDDESEEEKPKAKAAPTPKAAPPGKPAVPKNKEESDEETEEESEESEEEESEEESSEEEQENAKPAANGKKPAAKPASSKAAAAKEEEESKELRSPIFVVLGHVDAGKTKLLDKIRQTNVQEGEAGGITQQIGATYFPIEAIKAKTEMLRKDGYEYQVPGLLGIDTPGHESFTNLRSRGSSLCNIAILVVDIFNGLEPQTVESLNLLKKGKTPFVVAVNKVDRLYGWKSTPNGAIQDSLKDQGVNVIQEFETRMARIVTQFAEQGLNAVLYYNNTNFARNVSLVPTSAQTGEGVPDLLNLVVKLTQERMTKSLMYLSDLEATVLEVKVVEGLGTTIDVILSNGVLNEGDKIVVCGLNGPIVTTIRALLTPQPMREIRVKSAYIHHKQVKAALGVKIAANDLDKAIAGSRLLVVGPDDDEDDLKEEVQQDLVGLLSSIDKSGKGVCVQASTLGSLEALLSFLQDSKIPVSGINIGPVHKKDVIRASVMLEKAREYAQILAFDVKIDKDAEDLAEEVGVKIFQADVIYTLFDRFTAHMKEINEAKRRDQAPQAVFPCMLKIVPGAVFNKRNPIVIGVDVIEGQLRLGTPLAVVTADRGVVSLGKVTSIELNHKAREVIKKGEPAVAIKIECPSYETPKMIGRHFTEKDGIVSHITRQSIDVLKSTFRDDVSKDEWQTVVKLKKLLHID